MVAAAMAAASLRAVERVCMMSCVGLGGCSLGLFVCYFCLFMSGDVVGLMTPLRDFSEVEGRRLTGLICQFSDCSQLLVVFDGVA